MNLFTGITVIQVATVPGRDERSEPTSLSTFLAQEQLMVLLQGILQY